MMVPRTLNLANEQVAAVVSDENDWAILASCIRDAQPVRAIEVATGLPQATLYRRVRSLVDKGFLLVERSAISAAGKRYDLYRSRIRSVRLDLGPAGVRVQWEAMDGVEEHLRLAQKSLSPA